MFNKLTVRDLDLSGKRVLLRVDFNVPLDETGRTTDDSRIVSALPTINYIREQGGRVILISHLGRPKGKVVEGLSLVPCAERLSELLGHRIKTTIDCLDKRIRETISEMKEREVILLENLRFHAEETNNDPDFSKWLASLADLYVNDAFGTAHRKHASTYGVTRFINLSAAGFLLEREVTTLDKVLTDPERPFVTILGGAKISTKIGVIENLLNKVDILVIGGAMACTFLRAQGFGTGKSPVEEDNIGVARSVLSLAMERGVPIILPIDYLVARESREGEPTEAVYRYKIPPDQGVVDIGPVSLNEITNLFEGARTILWNGPVGIFEIDAFARGTEIIARAMAKTEVTTIIGGGDSIAALNKYGLTDRMTYVSTGGGATLEFLSGRELPGVASLTEKKT